LSLNAAPHDTPANEWEQRSTRRLLDELFCFARQYRTSDEYKGLLDFIVGFRRYAPYNAMLVHIQMPGAQFVLPAHRWAKDYGRTVKVSGRPLVILQTMGPVMFVFDVSDTEPGPNAKPLPPEVTDPFAVRAGCVGGEWHLTTENAKRDGVVVQPCKEGSQSGGSIRPATADRHLVFTSGNDRHGNPKQTFVRHRYDILLNDRPTLEATYASLVHELGHLYLGHLGTPNQKWWPDRRGLHRTVEEFEAESVSYLVCGRLGIETPSAEYLAGYLGKNLEVPEISIDAVMKAAGTVEKMGQKLLEPREAEGLK
jgi:hypothetical protein